ncbi:hypothetical protein BU17DRAFT_70877 [Hysterangium stoloniferum]|nr:hypothetical protein BU17DRAFT_70877 [Hysterangium stoloniferum]
MASSNENINPRSLPNLSNLLTHSAQKHPKSNKDHTGLKASSLHNVALDTFNDGQVDQEMQNPLPTPPCSRSSGQQTRLPISPPPEEELRVMELSAHAQSPRVFQSQSHIPMRSRPGAFKLPGPPQSFANFQQHTSPNVPESSALRSNSRKRARSFFPSIPISNSSKSLPSEAKPAAAAPSPNPKPRKQLKMYETGVYDGSGFKRRHTGETSLDENSESSMVKSPIRKKRRDPGLQDYTPQRESETTPSASRCTTRGRRSATPDVRYEAPAEQFTPPRSVVLSVPSSTTSVRSRSVKPPSSSGGGTRPSVERKVVTVKVERFTSPFPLPPVDLSKPVPPPSPTDDPLLLVGVDEPLRRCATPVDKRTLVDAAVGADLGDGNPPSTPIRHRSPSIVREINQSHWNFGSNGPEQTALMDVEFDGPSNFEATFNPGFDSDDDDNDNMANIDDGVFTQPPVAQFDPNETTGSHIFHSDDVEAQAGEDEGEFTGRFKFYNTPLKQDPPSSATRMRRESWGRPISPFPFSLRTNVLEENHNHSEVAQHVSLPLSPSPSQRRRTSITPRRHGRTLSEMEAILESKTANQNILADKPDQLSVVEEPHKELLNRNLGFASEYVDSSDEQESDGSENELCDEEEAVAVEREITPFDGSNGDDGDGRDNSNNGSNPPASPELYEDTRSSVDDENFLRDSSVRHMPALFTDFVVAVADDHTRSSHAYDDDDDSSEDDLPIGMVQVSSSDPRAAARAAAILKLHHAYVLDGDITKRSRRHSAHGVSRRASLSPGGAESSTEDSIRRARRKSLSSGGGVLQFKPRQTAHSPLSQTTFLAPHSPAVSAKEALEEAESDIRARSASPMRIVTPMRSMSLHGEIATSLPIEMSSQEGREGQQPAVEWGKVHWKMLDTCFTDERLAVGETMGLHGKMASVDDVALDAIVERFLIENEDSVTWDRQTLLRRVQALSARQRTGRGAPPSPHIKVIRDSTPTPGLRALVPPPEVDAPAKLPPTLLAPRYAHLLDEAKTIRATVSSTTVGSIIVSPTPISEDTSEGVTSPLLASTTSAQENSDIIGVPASSTKQLVSSTSVSKDASEDITPPVTASIVPMNVQEDSDIVNVPASSTKKVLNYLGSFLGRASDNVAPRKPTLQPSFSTALPLPPPEMRQIPRGPINTPAKKPLPKSQAPRELVHLTEVQPLPKQMEFPKTKSVREMVALNHIDPPRSVRRPRTISGPIVIPGRERRDSGSSVKDLVKSFEEVRKKTEEENNQTKSRPMIRKLASVNNLAGDRPIWKP